MAHARFFVKDKISDSLRLHLGLDESMEEYRMRRKVDTYINKVKMLPKFIWVSKVFGQKRGDGRTFKWGRDKYDYPSRADANKQERVMRDIEGKMAHDKNKAMQ